MKKRDNEALYQKVRYYKDIENNRAKARAKSIMFKKRHPLRVRDTRRRNDAIRNGYAPPPLEIDCPTKPTDGRCKLCKIIPNGKRGLVLDHCHKEGFFRGWLCTRCNVAIGSVEKIGLSEIINYLKLPSR